RGRVHAADFDDISKAILEDANIYYHAYICAVNPYPDRLQERNHAAKVWVKACDEHNLRIKFDEDMLKLVIIKRTGVYLHPIIQNTINKMWFKHKQDDGAIYPQFSMDSGIPNVTIALVITAVFYFTINF
ncbi:hypothetical protein BD779DRAFT_1412804, partial [Infundibulicybe gibba]